MNQETPQQARTVSRPSILWAISGAMVFVFLNHLTDGKVPGGAIGGAIGGVIGALLGLAVNSLRKK